VLPGLRPVAEAFRLPDSLALAPEPEDPEEPDEPEPPVQKARVPHTPPPGQALTTAPAPRRPAAAAAVEVEAEPEDDAPERSARRGRRPRKHRRQKKGGGLLWLAAGGAAAVVLLAAVGVAVAWALLGREPARADAGRLGGDNTGNVSPAAPKEPDKGTVEPPKDGGAGVAATPVAKSGEVGIRQETSGKGHTGIVSGICITRDGRVATASYDGTVRVWALNDHMKELHLFKVKQLLNNLGGLLHAVLSPDEKSTLICDGIALSLIDLESGAVRACSDKHTQLVTGLDINADGSVAVTVCLDKVARVWNLKTGKAVVQFTGTGNGMPSVRFLGDGSLVVSGGLDTALHVWESRTGKEVRHWETHGGKGVESLAVAPDGRAVVSGGRDKAVCVWDPSSGQERYHLDGFPNAVKSVAVSPDGRLGVASAFGAAKSQVRFWDMATGRELAKIEGPSYGLDKLTFSPDGRYLLGYDSDDAGAVRVYAVSGGPAEKEPPGDGGAGLAFKPAAPAKKIDSASVRLVHSAPTGISGRPTGTNVSPDGKVAAIADVSGSVRLWSIGPGQTVRQTFPQDPKLRKAWISMMSPDGKHLLTAAPDGPTITMWSLDKEAPTEEATFTGANKFIIHGLRFAADGKSFMAFTNQQGISVWNLASKKELRLDGTDKGDLVEIRMVPDSRHVLCTKKDGSWQLWDVEAGPTPKVLKLPALPVKNFEFSADGRRVVAIGSDNRIHILDLETGKEAYSTPVLQVPPHSVIVSPEGIVLATGNDSGHHHMWLWELATGRELMHQEGDKYWGMFFSITPDGHTLVGAGGSPWNFRVWEVTTRP
jgi:WD40 repeat protein